LEAIWRLLVFDEQLPEEQWYVLPEGISLLISRVRYATYLNKILTTTSIYAALTLAHRTHSNNMAAFKGSRH